MTNGLLFYWISWLLWVYVTFVMRKDRVRTILGLWILLIIGGSSINLTILGYTLTLSYLFLIVGAMIMLAKTSHLFFRLFSSFTIMILYMTMMVWQNYVPIYMIFSKTYIFPFVIAFITVLIARGFYNRVSITLLGISAGELMYSFILSSYSIKVPTGGFSFFDSVMIILFLFIGVEVANLLRVKVYALFGIYKKSIQVLAEE